jgi:dipeptide/tripeptide permease
VSFIGLFLIAVGTGGIKPCVAPFGAEQFELPQQVSDLGSFLLIHYGRSLRSIYKNRRMEGVLQHDIQKIGSFLYLLCLTTSKSVVQDKIHYISFGLCKYVCVPLHTKLV